MEVISWVAFEKLSRYGSHIWEGECSFQSRCLVFQAAKTVPLTYGIWPGWWAQDRGALGTEIHMGNEVLQAVLIEYPIISLTY
jgi:hypothetical protein